ncbi:transmembrane amino acid transporter [Ramaria rubella]|nr:transmembrane amino acid transporter [Ramaria rubella]
MSAKPNAYDVPGAVVYAIETDRKDTESMSQTKVRDDVFGNEEGHDIHYKTLSWPFVSLLMIAEIVSNGILSLPNALATVGIVPGVILIIFLGIFALFTAKLLVDFKLNHPGVHSMGDAGLIIFGPIGREVLSAGTLIFSIFAAGSELFAGQQALTTLSNNGLCSIYLILIFATASFFMSLPRTLSHLTWLGLASAVSILLCGVVGMIGSGVDPVPGRLVQATVPQTFVDAFLAISNPVFAYAGHFMFFILISEMRRPQDAMKAAWVLQVFSTAFYVLFAIVCYVYIGSDIESLSLLSLSPTWSKVAFAIGLPNFLVGGGLYIHVPAKLVFVRIFRNSKHVHSHTYIGWITWICLCFVGAAVAFIFAVGVPIFSLLIGLTAALFASWYTYGIAGFFYLHDVYHLGGGRRGLKKHPWMVLASVLTILAGAFICVSGTYVFIKQIISAYASGEVGKPFTC